MLTTASELALLSLSDVSQMVKFVLNGDSLGEHEQLKRPFELANWNRSQVARILGVSEGTVRNWIKKCGITRP